jgi:hypothetical protein
MKGIFSKHSAQRCWGSLTGLAQRKHSGGNNMSNICRENLRKPVFSEAVMLD